MISLSFSFKQGQFYELCTHLLCAMNSFCGFDQVKDEFENGNPLSSFVVGQKVKAKVLVKLRTKRTASRAGVGDHLFELSLRPSQLTGAASCPSLYFSCSVSQCVWYCEWQAGLHVHMLHSLHMQCLDALCHVYVGAIFT